MRLIRDNLPLLLAATVLSAACQKKPSAPPDNLARFTNGLSAVIATCALTKGQVEVKRAGRTSWGPIEAGAVFQAGDEMRTGSGSFARIEFLSGGRLELEETASVLIDAAPAMPQGVTVSTPSAQENRVKVGSGVVRGFLPEAKPGQEQLGMVIDSGEGEPVKVSAEPGKKPVAFRVTHSRNKTELAVTQGQARLTAKGGRVQAVHSGQTVEVTGAGVTDPDDLIDFPQSLEPGIDARFHFASKLSIRLAWKPVPEAAGYRVQVANDLSFQAPVVADVQGTEYLLSPRATGLHAWRVAARDGKGRYGDYGFARRIFCEQEQPKELLIGPEDNAVFRYADSPPRISFSWESAASARSYRLVVSNGPSLLDQKVVSMVSTGQRLDVEGLGAGEYYWGVYVDSDQNLEPIFVKPRRLLVQKGAGAKAKVPKEISEWGK